MVILDDNEIEQIVEALEEKEITRVYGVCCGSAYAERQLSDRGLDVFGIDQLHYKDLKDVIQIPKIKYLRGRKSSPPSKLSARKRKCALFMSYPVLPPWRDYFLLNSVKLVIWIGDKTEATDIQPSLSEVKQFSDEQNWSIDFNQEIPDNVKGGSYMVIINKRKS